MVNLIRTSCQFVIQSINKQLPSRLYPERLPVPTVLRGIQHIQEPAFKRFTETKESKDKEEKKKKPGKVKH